MGLLSKASSLDFSEKLAFLHFINSHKIKTCALYEYKNNSFYIQNSIGFDSLSLIASKSTKDFWDGICPENNTIYSFTKENSLECLQQFFSFEMNEIITFIEICRIQDKLLLLVNEKITPSMINDFTKIDNSIYTKNISTHFPNLQSDFYFFQYEINLEKITESYENFIQLSIKNEIANRIESSYSVENFAIRLNENKIRICFIEKNSFNKKIYPKHLKLLLSQIIDKNAKKIEISFIGKTSNVNEIQNFMKAD